MSKALKKETGHYKFDIIVLSLLVVDLLVYKLYFRRLSYISGLEGNFPFCVAMPLFLILLGVFAALIILALVRLIGAISKVCNGREGGWARLALSFASFVVGSALFVGVGGGEAGAVDFLRGYEKWVQKEVDIAAIQKWLMSLDSVYSESTYFEAEDYPEELPAAIKKLEPQYIFLGEFDGEQRSVELGWGGGFGDWGIRIGLPGMETPEEGFIDLDGPIYEFRRPVQPGVYVFSRG